jgi:hypothetical protein
MKSLIKRILFLLLMIPRNKIPDKRKYIFDPIIESLALKAKNRKEVACEYGVDIKTLKVRLKEKNIYLPPGLIFPETLKIIYYALGRPSGLKNT